MFSILRQILATFPAVMIASAYLYSEQYFSEFGINTRDYFSIGDYLAASIEVAYTVGLFVASCILGLFFAWIKSINNNFDDANAENGNATNASPFSKKETYVLIIGGFLFSTIGFLIYPPYFFSMAIPLMLYGFIIYLIFVRPGRINFTILAPFLLLILSVFVEASTDIRRTYRDIDAKECISLEFKKSAGMSIDPCDYAFVGLTSNYIFLASKEENYTIAIRNDLNFQRKHEFRKRYSDYPDWALNIRKYIRGLLPIGKEL